MILNYKYDALSILGNGKILDENGQIVFRIKRKLLSITRKVKIYNKDNELLYVVRNKFFKIYFKSAFISSNGKKIAKVTRKIAIKDNYSVQGFEQDVRIDGSVLGTSYRIIVNEKCVAEIKCVGLFKGNQLVITDEDDAGFVVALYLAITNIIYQNK